MVFGGRYPSLYILTHAVAVGVGGLGTHAQFAFPYGIGEYEFGCQHPATVLCIAVDVAVFQFCASFRLDVSADGLLP